MAYCTNCGSSVPEGARICPNCNHPQPSAAAPPTVPAAPPQPAAPMPGQGPAAFPGPTYAPPPPSRTDGGAITALVLGILGVVFCPIVLSVPAIFVGRSAQSRIEASGGTLGGLEMAKAGWILGIIGTILAVLGAIFFVIIFSMAAFQGF